MNDEGKEKYTLGLVSGESHRPFWERGGVAPDLDQPRIYDT